MNFKRAYNTLIQVDPKDDGKERKYHIDRVLAMEIQLTKDGPQSGSRQVGENEWFIGIGHDDGLDTTPFIKLIHELGHVLGQAFQGHIRTAFDGFVQETQGIATENTIKEENRAWDIAQQLFNSTKASALATYSENAKSNHQIDAMMAKEADHFLGAGYGKKLLDLKKQIEDERQDAA